MRRAAAVLLLAACSPEAPDTPRLGLVLTADGVRPATSPLRVEFGRTEASAVASVSRILGEDPIRQSLRAGCGRATEWPSGLHLIFVDETLEGWTAPPGRYPADAAFEVGPDGRIGAGETCRS